MEKIEKKLPNGVVETQIAGSHSQSFWFSKFGEKPKNLHFSQVLRYGQGHPLKTMVLNYYAKKELAGEWNKA